jgi:hypothetical protein
MSDISVEARVLTEPGSMPARLASLYAWSRAHKCIKNVREFLIFFRSHIQPGDKGPSESSVRRCLDGNNLRTETEEQIAGVFNTITLQYQPRLESTSTVSIKRPRSEVNTDDRLDEMYKGVWTFVQFRATRRKATDTLAPREFRAAQIVYGDEGKKSLRRPIEVFGMHTQWKGNAYTIDGKIYFTAREQNSGKEDLFIICFPAYERNPNPQHEGIVLGVARSAIDSPYPIYASRCLIKKNPYLSGDVAQSRKSLLENKIFRSQWCKYFAASDVRLRSRRKTEETEENFLLRAVMEFKRASEDRRVRENEASRIIFSRVLGELLDT